MKRSPPAPRRPPAAARVQTGAEVAGLALREARGLMAPVALWLLRNGVSYPAFAEMLKAVFVDAARGELARSATQPTQSALSLLSGVHRKDVRNLGDEPGRAAAQRRPPLSSQVFTRWLGDARYRDKAGAPRVLPRSGARRSFEGLCREVSNDVHPRAVLDELLRLGLVELDGDQVVARVHSFVPSSHLDEMTVLFSANAADHIAAAVSNLTLKAEPFLEQSVYADGLTPESVEILHRAARAAWTKAFEAMVEQARDRVDRDMRSDGSMRVRFGSYFFSEPVVAPAESGPVPGDAKHPVRRPARPAAKPTPDRRRVRPKSP